MAAKETFSIRDLQRVLAIEVTRADSSFVRTQAAARQAMESDFLPGEVRIESPPLEIARLELELALVSIRKSWFIRARSTVWGWLGGKTSAEHEPHFQFAAEGKDGVQHVKCILQRDTRGRFRALVDEVSDNA